MSIDARTLRQFAELSRAGHLNHFDLTQLQETNRVLVQRALELNSSVGGPIAKTLDRIANVISMREQNQTELELAVAGPKSSARLVLSLPVLVFLGAGIAGIPIFRTLATPSVVWVSLGLGLTLFWVGNRWTSRLMKKAKPNSGDIGLELDLLGVVVQAGLPLSVARDYVVVSEQDELQTMAETTGIALVDLITNRADEARREQHNADRLAIQKTSVAVLWPLGLTVLPAFVLMAVVPIAAALLQTKGR